MVWYVSTNRLRGVPGRLVAAHAIGRGQRIVVADMAGGAGRRRRRHVSANQRKAGRAVIERRAIPAQGGMALRTVRRGEGCTRCRVHRIVGLLPGRQVALRIAAIRRLDGQVVIPIDMAQGTLHVGVAIR